MKKSIMGVLALLWVSMIVLGGCSSPKVKIFSLESPQKITVTSISGEKIEVTDEDIIQQITDNITSIQFERGESSEDTNGFGPIISWYNSNGDVMETISVMSNDTIIYNNYFWTAVNGSIDMEVINATLPTDTGEKLVPITRRNTPQWMRQSVRSILGHMKICRRDIAFLPDRGWNGH